MTDNYQWYGSVTYEEDLASDITAGLSQMERWNTGTASFELSGTEECMKNLSHYLVVGTREALARLGVNCEIIMADSKEHECPVDMTYEKRNVIRARTSRSRTRTRQYTIPISMQWYGTAGKVMVKVRGRLKGGWLKSTGTVEKIEGEDAYELGYHTPYAHRQHEDLTFHHTKPGAKAKYLEDPVMRRVPLIAEDIGEHLRGIFG